MDPLGLAFENFNALGRWRDKERGQPIDAAGKLVTGESFTGVKELKHILVTEHRRDFYRCLSEKMLTYALGRGLEYHDTMTVDQLVDRLDSENGRPMVLDQGHRRVRPHSSEAGAGQGTGPEPETTGPPDATRIHRRRGQIHETGS